MILTKRDLLNAKNGAILQFSGEDNGTGNIVFNNNLALSSSSPVTMSMQQTFNIDGADAYFSNNINTSGSLLVAEAATLEKTLTVTQGSTLQGTLDVTGESIFATNTTVSGTLKAESDLDFSAAGGNLKAGSVNALTVNSSGEVTKIGQDTPTDGQFLKWDGSGNKVVWDAASVVSLSLDNLTAGTSNSRVQTSGDLHLDSTGGEIFLSSSDDFNFLSDDSNTSINFYNTGVTTAGVGQINLSIIDKGGNKNLSTITFNGLSILDKNNDTDTLTGLGVKGAEISNKNSIDSQYGAMFIGTKNTNPTDLHGQNASGSLVLGAMDNRFIYCDVGTATYSGYPTPFFHIKKHRAIATNYAGDFEVEFNATKGIVGNWISNFYNGTMTHSTFLKFNQDGQITKLGHDTPTDGQVLSWDNSSGYAVWSDASTGSETLAGLTDTNISSPSDGDYLKYDASSSKWIPSTGPVSETYSSKIASFTAAVDYHYSIDTTNNAVTVTLPDITNTNIGKKIIIKFKAGSNTLKVNAHSGETIEGVSDQTLSPGQNPGQSMILVSDGTSNWEII